MEQSIMRNIKKILSNKKLQCPYLKYTLGVWIFFKSVIKLAQFSNKSKNLGEILITLHLCIYNIVWKGNDSTYFLGFFINKNKIGNYMFEIYDNSNILFINCPTLI